jgi:hypothetical protein
LRALNDKYGFVVHAIFLAKLPQRLESPESSVTVDHAPPAEKVLINGLIAT